MSHACVHSYRESNSLYDTSHRWWNPRNKQLNCSSFIIHVILQPCNNNNNGAPRGRHTKPSFNTTLVRKKSHKRDTWTSMCSQLHPHCLSLILVLRFRAPAEKGWTQNQKFLYPKDGANPKSRNQNPPKRNRVVPPTQINHLITTNSTVMKLMMHSLTYHGQPLCKKEMWPTRHTWDAISQTTSSQAVF